MKIAIIIENFKLTSGGSERSTDQIARGLISRGHKVTILTNQTDARGRQLAGGEVRVADGLSTRNALGLIGFNEWVQTQLQAGDYDVSLSMTTSVAADVVQPRNGTVRENFEQRVAIRSNGLFRWLKRVELWLNTKRQTMLAAERMNLCSPSVKRIVPISRYVADQLKRYYDIPADRLCMIYNSAEVSPIDAEMRQSYRSHIRETLGFDSDDVVFLFAAMDPKLKGLGSLLPALQKVRQDHPEAKVIVAGTVSRTHKRLAQKLGLVDSVRWVGPVDGMEQYYAAASVTVLPTWFDSSSRVVLESLLYGTPAISTLFDGSAQWIYSPSGEHEVPMPYQPNQAPIVHNRHSAGRIVRSPQDVNALADAMRQMCDPAIRDQCAQATEGIEQHIRFDGHLDTLEQVLFEVAGVQSSPIAPAAFDSVPSPSASVA